MELSVLYDVPGLICSRSLNATGECRSSPFFWAFGEGLIRDRDMASAIFAFTDSIPGAYIGQAVQEIDMQAGSLVSKVKMTVFPALSGTVITTSTITGIHQSVCCSVLATRYQECAAELTHV